MINIKKWLTAALAAIVCLGSTGCAGNLGGYPDIKKAQERIGELQSGRIVVNTAFEKGKKAGSMTTEFLFRQKEDGTITYCQTQFDKDNKTIYCEYSDGSRVERWLIGKGWSEAEEQICNKENPHRYLKLLETPIEKKSISQIVTEEDGENTRFILTLDPAWLNENTYTDQTAEAVSETVTILLDKDGNLLRWQNEAVILDVASQMECYYRLDMQLTDLNMVGEIEKPELRTNFQMKTE